MSYKKIVAGIATAAVASALVAPVAFAGPIEQDDYYPEVSAAQADAQAVKDAEDVLAAARLALKAGQENNANVAKADEAQKFVDKYGKQNTKRQVQDGANSNAVKDGVSQVDLDQQWVIIDTYGNLTNEDLDKLQDNVDALEADLAAAKADADYVAYLNLEKVWDSSVYKDARKSADKHAKNSLAPAQDALDELAVNDLVSLPKTYEQQTRAIEMAKKTTPSSDTRFDDEDESNDRDYASANDNEPATNETPKQGAPVKPSPKKEAANPQNKIEVAVKPLDKASEDAPKTNEAELHSKEVEKVIEELHTLDRQIRNLIEQKYHGQDYSSIMLSDPENPGEKISLEEFIKRVEGLKHDIYLLTYRLNGNWLDDANAKLELLRNYLAVLEDSDIFAVSKFESLMTFLKSGSALTALGVSVLLGAGIALVGFLLVPFKRKKEQGTTEELLEGEQPA